MSIVTKSEWVDWKQNPVTNAFYSAIKERISEATELLVNKAGLDQVEDNFFRGFIAAYNEVLGFSIEDMEDLE